MTMIADVRKNARETIRAVRDEYQGHQLVHVRVWYQAEDGELRPTEKGLAFKVDHIPEVIEALQKAQGVAG